MDLNGRHVVVTGAAGGIGSALARRFHRAGAKLVLADQVAPSGVAAELPGAVAVKVDLSTEQGNIDLIDQAEAAFGTVDLFFANAGVALGTDPMDAEEVWDLSFAINTHAHRWAARRLLPAWLERGDGYFCSTASAAGLLAQIGSAPYSVTKHAAVAFAEWLSITYGSRGLRVSCLCPQGVNTAMLRGGDRPAENAAINPNAGNVVRAAGAVLEPHEVADAVHDALVAERFFVFPHPEVADYMKLKATEHERWLGGMRKLQRRVFGV